MHHAKTSYLITVAKILQKGGKNYCNSSQGRTLELLKNIHGIDIKVRCLKKHISELVEQGYIKSIRRYKRHDDGTCIGLPSAVCLTVKGCSYLYKQGVQFALQILKKLSKYTGYLKKAAIAKTLPESVGQAFSLENKQYSMKDDPLYIKLRGHRVKHS